MMMRSSSFESPKSYLYGHNLKNRKAVLLRYVIFIRSTFILYHKLPKSPVFLQATVSTCTVDTTFVNWTFKGVVTQSWVEFLSWVESWYIKGTNNREMKWQHKVVATWFNILRYTREIINANFLINHKNSIKILKN